MQQISVIENVLKLNDELAAMNRQTLREAGVFCVNLIGGPGCGKTALLETTLKQLAGLHSVGVLVGDLATTRDATRLAAHATQVVQINTGKACHLEAHQVRQAMGRLNLDALDILVIENVGNLICPVGFDLGQDVKVGMCSVAEGDDKPAKHPPIIAAVDALLLNKMDLIQHVPFSLERFYEDVARLNPALEVLEVSAHTQMIDPWIDWLLANGLRHVQSATDRARPVCR